MAGLTYDATGVRYEALDAFKRACQQHAAATAGALANHGVREAEHVRGESAYLLDTGEAYWAHVEEGLGTKNLVADAMAKLTGRSYYHAIGIDTVATIVNDLVTTGALPLSVAMHLAVGDTRWFADEARALELVRGFARGCEMAGAAWGGGETPALRGIVEAEGAVLAGSAIGRILPKHHRVMGDLHDGDAIILLASSGVQTNGLSLCRAVADRLPRGYLTTLKDGQSFGESLLSPSIIYVPFVAAMQRAGVTLKYLAHITGHGWRKLMRPTQPFVYEMTDLGPGLEIFRFLREAGPISVEEAYATFNMGAGFAAYVDPADAQACLDAASRCQIPAWRGGTVRQRGDRKAVEILPLSVTFEAGTLQVR